MGEHSVCEQRVIRAEVKSRCCVCDTRLGTLLPVVVLYVIQIAALCSVHSGLNIWFSLRPNCLRHLL